MGLTLTGPDSARALEPSLAGLRARLAAAAMAAGGTVDQLAVARVLAEPPDRYRGTRARLAWS